MTTKRKAFFNKLFLILLALGIILIVLDKLKIFDSK